MNGELYGDRRAKAVDMSWGLTNGGGEYLAIQFQLLDEDVAGKRLTYYGRFTEKTEDSTLEALVTLGWTGSDLSTLTKENLTNEVLLKIQPKPKLNKELVQEVDADGNPVMVPEVRFINRIGVTVKQALPADKLKLLSARLKAKAAVKNMNNGALQRATPVPVAAAAPKQEDLDEIPF